MLVKTGNHGCILAGGPRGHGRPGAKERRREPGPNGCRGRREECIHSKISRGSALVRRLKQRSGKAIWGIGLTNAGAAQRQLGTETWHLLVRKIKQGKQQQADQSMPGSVGRLSKRTTPWLVENFCGADENCGVVGEGLRVCLMGRWYNQKKPFSATSRF